MAILHTVGENAEHDVEPMDLGVLVALLLEDKRERHHLPQSESWQKQHRKYSLSCPSDSCRRLFVNPLNSGTAQEGQTPGKDQGWCAEAWCYVDPCNCELDEPATKVPEEGGYMPHASYMAELMIFYFPNETSTNWGIYIIWGNIIFCFFGGFRKQNPRLSGAWHVVLLQNLWWQGVGRQSCMWEPRHGDDCFMFEGFPSGTFLGPIGQYAEK